ncbi:hypothetical protein OfM1_14760 [Lactovum odontotermitis]
MNPKKRKLAILLSIIIIIIVALGGIGGKIYMDNQAVRKEKQEELEKRLIQTKKEVTELLEWNYIDIQSVTFDYGGWDGSGVQRVSLDKSLTETLAGGLTINGWVNGDEECIFECDLEVETLKPKSDPLATVGEIGYGEAGGSFSDTGGTLGKLYKSGNESHVWLTLPDISDLKEKGFTKLITAQEIKQYFKEKSK